MDQLGMESKSVFKKAFDQLTQRLKNSDLKQNSSDQNTGNTDLINRSADQIGRSVETGIPDGSKPVELGSGIISRISSEGVASVLYEIHNMRFGFKRIVKLLRPNQKKENLNYFLREFRISAQLNHPDIVTVYDSGLWHDLPYIEMEKINGFTLSELCNQGGPLPIGLCTSIGIILCKTLDYLHQCKFTLGEKEFRGLLHLDLKPSHIMLSEKGILKIIDFRLSTPIQEARSGLKSNTARSTASISYGAPEVILSTGNPDVTSDIYSLGCILFEIASGTKAFQGSEPEIILENRKTNQHVPLQKLNRSIPREYAQLVEKCLSSNQNERPSEAPEVQRVLEGIHKRITSISPEDALMMYINQKKLNEPLQLPEPVKHTSTLVYASAFVTALCTGVLIFLLIWKPDQIRAMGTSIIEIMTHGTGQKVVPVKKSPNPQDLPYNGKLNEPESGITGNSIKEENSFYFVNSNPVISLMLDSLRKAWTLHNFEQMLLIISNMPPQQAQTKEVILYKLRALGKNNEELGKALSVQEINDGEFYFHKSRYLASKQDYPGAIENLNKAENLPSEFINKVVLGEEIRLLKARCLTGVFRNSPTSENLKSALNYWDELINKFKDDPNSIQCRQAISERQNLAAEAQWRGLK
jgi:serine/threonine protein kinase